MKRISESLAQKSEAHSTQSLGQGVMNHYTPIDNIIINVRNFFGSLLGLVVMKGEDGFSLKVTSSSFTTPDVTREILYTSTFDGRTYLANFIHLQGLTKLKIVDIGSQCIAYFCPEDIKAAQDPEKMCKDAACAACKEMKEANIIEAEMSTMIKEEAEEIELEDKTHEEIVTIISKQNKIEAASELSALIEKKLPLKENIYIKATKDIEGHESIAVRYRYEKRRPFGGKMPVIVSLINIYSAGTNAVWAGCFDEQENYPEEILTVVEQILELLGAQKTSDKCVYDIPESEIDDKDKKPEDDDDKDDKNDQDDDDLNSNDDNDNDNNGVENDDDNQ